VSNNTTSSGYQIALTSSGQYQVVVGGSGAFYSTNYGVFWTNVATPVTFSGVAMSSNGQFMTACFFGSGTYTSIIPQGNLYASLTGSNTTANPLLYNSTTKSIGYNTGKTFVIDHPLHQNKYLVHACLEGPEMGVYYRGKGTIENEQFTIVRLPDYVDKIAKNFTVQVTPIYDSSKNERNKLTTGNVVGGQFYVYGKNGDFYWKVMGQRGEALEIEPAKETTEIRGEGPYQYIELLGPIV
jgi:hypothetical protein